MLSGTVALFLALWIVIAVQLALGSDPALVRDARLRELRLAALTEQRVATRRHDARAASAATPVGTAATTSPATSTAAVTPTPATTTTTTTTTTESAPTPVVAPTPVAPAPTPVITAAS